MKHFFLKALLLFVINLAFWANLSFATIEHPEPNHPNTGELYRVDTRNQSEVFEYGFFALGNNDSLFEHVRGRSCRAFNGDSAFISLSASHDWAMNYLLRQTTHVSGQTYLYRIRSNDFTHNMQTSLLAERPDYQPGLNTALLQSEWIAYRHIPREDIQSVDIYAEGRFIRTENNPYFMPRAPNIQTSPYLSNNIDPPIISGTTTIFERIAPVVTACFSSDFFSCSSSNLTKLPKQDNCESRKSIDSLFIMYKTKGG